MNFFAYFCIPLVVTGQLTPGGLNGFGGNVGFGLNNPSNPLLEFGGDQEGPYFRKPLIEDTGEVGKPSIYNVASSVGRNNEDHPSVVASDVYNSIKDKLSSGKIRSNNDNQQPRIPPDNSGDDPVITPALEVGLQDAAYLAGHYEQQKFQQSQSQSQPTLLGGLNFPAGSLSSLLSLRSPYSGQGQILQSPSPLHQSPLVSLFHPSSLSHSLSLGASGTFPVPTHSSLASSSDAIPVTQQVVPMIHSPFIKAASAPSIFLKSFPMQLQRQPSLLQETAPAAVPLAHAHHPLRLMKTASLPLLYRSAASMIPLTMIPIMTGAPAGSPSLTPSLTQSLTPSLTPIYFNVNALAPTLYRQPLLKPVETKRLQPHILKSTLLKTPITSVLKHGPSVEATVVPAIELASPKAQPHTYYQPTIEVGQKLHKDLLVQKSIQRPAVLTEKEVLKAALAPVYASSGALQKAIFKAPLLTHYANNGHLESEIPANILSSHKSVLNALISGEEGSRKSTKGQLSKTTVELLPSLSYGFSYSMFPKPNGSYGPPDIIKQDEDHHHHNHHHHNHYESQHEPESQHHHPEDDTHLLDDHHYFDDQ